MGTLLGARVKEARLKRKLSGAEMARSIGMDVGQYHRLEHADNADPSFAAVVRIARKLDVSLDWLALAVGRRIQVSSETKIQRLPQEKFFLQQRNDSRELLENETLDVSAKGAVASPPSSIRKRKTNKCRPVRSSPARVPPVRIRQMRCSNVHKCPANVANVRIALVKILPKRLVTATEANAASMVGYLMLGWRSGGLLGADGVKPNTCRAIGRRCRWARET